MRKYVIGVLVAIPLVVIVAFVVLVAVLSSLDWEAKPLPDVPLARCVAAYNAGRVDWVPGSGQAPQATRSVGRIARRVDVSGSYGQCVVSFQRGARAYPIADNREADLARSSAHVVFTPDEAAGAVPSPAPNACQDPDGTLRLGSSCAGSSASLVDPGAAIDATITAQAASYRGRAWWIGPSALSAHAEIRDLHHLDLLAEGAPPPANDYRVTYQQVYLPSRYREGAPLPQAVVATFPVRLDAPPPCLFDPRSCMLNDPSHFGPPTPRVLALRHPTWNQTVILAVSGTTPVMNRALLRQLRPMPGHAPALRLALPRALAEEMRLIPDHWHALGITNFQLAHARPLGSADGFGFLAIPSTKHGSCVVGVNHGGRILTVCPVGTAFPLAGVRSRHLRLNLHTELVIGQTDWSIVGVTRGTQDVPLAWQTFLLVLRPGDPRHPTLRLRLVDAGHGHARV